MYIVRGIQNTVGMTRNSLAHSFRMQKELSDFHKCLPRYFVSDGKCLASADSKGYKPLSQKVDHIEMLHSDDRFVRITWNSGKQSRFPYIFLRENCKCPSCFHPAIKQRLVFVNKETSEIDSMAIKDNGYYLECRWSDGHVSKYGTDWLKHRCLVEYSDKEKSVENISIVKDSCKLISSQYNLVERAHDFEAVMKDDKSLLDWLFDLHSYGLTLIQNAPAKEGVLLYQLAKRIGYPKATIHGATWSLKDTGQVNLAYSNKFLELHTDFPQMISPPDVQILHCIEQATFGGSNSFVDGYSIALELKEKNPNVFDTLTSKKIPRHDGAVNGYVGEFLLDQSRPIIELNHKGQVDKIFYVNFTFADYFEDMSPEEVIDFYDAKAAFAEYFHSQELVIRHKLRAGEIVAFDNNRILHGRDSFTSKPGGGRWLDGGSFDWDAIVSKIKVLNRRLGFPLPFKYHTPPHYS